MALPTLDPMRWKALALLCAAQFIVILDTSIIGVALPAIQSDLGFTDEGLSWIFNAYVIAFGGLLLLGGKLADVYGARRIFLWGFAILTAASAVAGLAESQTMLLSGRALQGVGAALIAPAALTILMRLFGGQPAELGKAFGFWGASAAAGGTAGVFLGGVITEWMSWSWTFLINLPLGLAVLFAGPAVLRAIPGNRGKIGLIDSALVTGSVVAAVYAIVTGEQVGWFVPQTLGLLGLAAALLVAFLILQATSSTPLLPLRIFRAPGLAAGNLVMALLGAAWIPLWFFLNLYLQSVLNLSALGSGLALLPMTLMIMLMMVRFTGPLIGRFGVKPVLVTGLIALSVSLAMFAWLPADGTFLGNVLPISLLAAVGMSLAYIPVAMTGTAMPGMAHDMAGDGQTAMPGMDHSGMMKMGGMSMGAMDLNDFAFDAYLANDRTLDDPEVVPVDKGGRVILRIINGAAATVFWIDTGSLSGRLMATDGNAVVPVSGSRFGLAMGQRLDIEVTIPAEGGAFPILALREGAVERTGLVLATSGAAVTKLTTMADTAHPAFSSDLAQEAVLRAATRLADRPPDRTDNLMLGGSMMPYRWTIDGQGWGSHRPILAKTGERVVLTFHNMSMMAHPMHLHGHVFQVVALNGQAMNGALRDTVHVPPMSMVSVALDAGEAARWMLHCHHMPHLATGMMTEFTVSA